jgi:hypothetical protein
MAQDNENRPGGVRRGIMGDVSSRLGYDVRDLMTAGYSYPRIQGVLSGELYFGGIV